MLSKDTLRGKETGLGWDHEKGTISATDEWWDLKVKENSKFEAFREEEFDIELECKMDQIFEFCAQGVLKYTPTPTDENGGVSRWHDLSAR
nr:L10-interacting MYB domain-containing protein-like [Ipomoea batatas]